MLAKDIVLLGCQIAKGPGMVFIGGQFLNLVLEDLVLNRDLQINRVTQMITVAPNTYGPFALEAEYLRTYDLFYPIPTTNVGGTGPQGGVTQFLTSITMQQFDAEFKSPSVANYPYERATDLSVEAQQWSGIPGQSTLLSAGSLYIYPQSSGNIVLTHRYMVKRDPIVNPSQALIEPWFRYSEYLVNAVAARVMGVTGDNRVAEYNAMCENMLRPYLIMGSNDEQQAVHNIELDPRRFRPNRGLRPVKAYPF